MDSLLDLIYYQFNSIADTMDGSISSLCPPLQSPPIPRTRLILDPRPNVQYLCGGLDLVLHYRNERNSLLRRSHAVLPSHISQVWGGSSTNYGGGISQVWGGSSAKYGGVINQLWGGPSAKYGGGSSTNYGGAISQVWGGHQPTMGGAISQV